MDAAKIQILAIVDNQHFDQIFTSMKNDIALKMMETELVDELIKLRDEVRALDRLQGKLTEIANDVRMTR
jgi:glucose-6-phosphate dehydrogenase assembly protein OpcA